MAEHEDHTGHEHEHEDQQQEEQPVAKGEEVENKEKPEKKNKDKKLNGDYAEPIYSSAGDQVCFKINKPLTLHQYKKVKQDIDALYWVGIRTYNDEMHRIFGDDPEFDEVQAWLRNRVIKDWVGQTAKSMFADIQDATSCDPHTHAMKEGTLGYWHGDGLEIPPLTMEECTTLIDYKFVNGKWGVENVKKSCDHVYGNIRKSVRGDIGGDIGGDIFGDVEGTVWGNVNGTVRGTIEGEGWGKSETTKDKIMRLVRENAPKSRILREIEKWDGSPC